MTEVVSHIGLGKITALREAIGPNRRVAFVSGNFNIIHPGHSRLLQFARDNADVVVVGVQAQTRPGVTVPAALRLEAVQALSKVDHAFILDVPLADALIALRPHVVVKGREFQDHFNFERDIVEAYGGRLIFGSGEVRFSSLELIQREYHSANLSSIRKPLDFLQRCGFGMSQLRNVLSKFAGMRVVVVGDAIVDSYVTCDPLGMSQEDPTIVVTPIEESIFVGAAGIVAAHASGLGADTSFISVVGDDQPAQFSREELSKHGVKAELLVDLSRPTTFKRRYRALGKTLLRVNTLRQHPIEPDLCSKLIRSVTEALEGADLLLFSDFNYGCLPQAVVDAITEAAAARGIPAVADSQASSQLSDISRFKGMSLVTPTEREARLALRDFESGLVVLAERLQNVANAETVFITLGSEGLLGYARDGVRYVTERLPAFNTDPRDVSGAGDSLFTCSAMALRAGAPPFQAMYLGALAAACQVSRVGNTPLSQADLLTEIDHADFMATEVA